MDRVLEFSVLKSHLHRSIPFVSLPNPEEATHLKEINQSHGSGRGESPCKLAHLVDARQKMKWKIPLT